MAKNYFFLQKNLKFSGFIIFFSLLDLHPSIQTPNHHFPTLATSLSSSGCWKPSHIEIYSSIGYPDVLLRAVLKFFCFMSISAIFHSNPKFLTHAWLFLNWHYNIGWQTSVYLTSTILLLSSNYVYYAVSEFSTAYFHHLNCKITLSFDLYPIFSFFHVQ